MSTAVTDRPAAPPRVTLTKQRSRPGELIFRLALQACLLIAGLFLVWLLIYAVYKGWNRLDSRLWTEMPTGLRSRVDSAGVQSAIVSTLWLMVMVAAICMPLGIAAAIYLEEYADTTRWYNRWLELNIQNLAGVPSIIFGILGLGFARYIGWSERGLLLGAIVLALLVLPVIIIATREAIRSVPQSIRHASYALGATKWQTVARQVLPSAVPGIATGSILGLSRAVGEAAPLIIIGAFSFALFNPTDLVHDQYSPLPVHIFALLSESRESFQEIGFAAIVLLLGLVLIMNSIAIFVRNKFQKRW